MLGLKLNHVCKSGPLCDLTVKYNYVSVKPDVIWSRRHEGIQNSQLINHATLEANRSNLSLKYMFVWCHFNIHIPVRRVSFWKVCHLWLMLLSIQNEVWFIWMLAYLFIFMMKWAQWLISCSLITIFIFLGLGIIRDALSDASDYKPYISYIVVVVNLKSIT